VKSLPLSMGLVAIVCDADYEAVALFKWTAQKGKNGCYYAYRRDAFGRKVYLHREIVGAQPNETVDHKNGDGLDCRRRNLRRCTNAQNMQNMRRGRGISSFKGVGWFRRDSKWRAYIVQDAQQIHLGYFDHEEDAARAYDSAAIKLFGQFAKVNFP
jgi:AP2 domain/HNH endonuclease